MKSSLPWKRIVAGITAEGHGVPAAQRAYSLAAGPDVSVRLVHGLEIPSLWGGVRPPEQARRHPEFLTAARARVLDVLARNLADTFVPASRLADDLHVVPGPPGKVLLSECAGFGADLLVLGPHRKRNLIDFGSTARAVLSRLELPLWVQTTELDGPEVRDLKRILVPVDFSESTRPAVDAALALARHTGAGVRFLHCYAPPTFAYTDPSGESVPPVPDYVVEDERKDAENQLARFLDEGSFGDVDVGSSFHVGDPVDEICAEAKGAGEGGHDLIVIGTHGRTGLSRFLLGSVAYGTLRRSDHPVLVVPARQRTWLLEEGWSPA